MEPPLKRPRLSMFADEPDNTVLARARRQNDMLLKSRFESIFAKYSQDFTSIGDEIDLNTGEIVVDNGHISALKDENDTGHLDVTSKPSTNGTSVANGHSMLRAMTVAPDRDDSYFEDESADDVIASIETIAGVITISDDEESDSDVEMGDDSTPTEERDLDPAAEPKPATPLSAFHGNATGDGQDRSDADSLFETGRRRRNSSPDSLFEAETPEDPTVASDPTIKQDPETQEIIAKFGVDVGREVLSLIAKRDNLEKHIEPAWRIPVKPANLPQSSSSSVPRLDGTADRPVQVLDLMETSEDEMQSVTPQQITPSPNKGRSLWQKRVRRSKSEIQRDRAWQRAREESEDPLQDGFNSAEAEDSPFEAESDEEADVERCTSIVKRGVCPWCKEKYTDQSRVLQHLRRVIRQDRLGKTMQGNHNVEHIARIRPRLLENTKARGKGSRPSRMVVSDFKTMVELHEAGGYAFEYIITERFLHTKNKDVDKLRVLYEKFRSFEDDEEHTYAEPWTRREENLIASLASKPFTTMDTIRRKLRTRSDREIGGYLAKKWLRECRGDVDFKYEIDEKKFAAVHDDQDAEGETDDELGESAQDDDSEDDLFAGPSMPASGSQPRPYIKMEPQKKTPARGPRHEDDVEFQQDESDDDLFVGPSFPASGASFQPTIKAEIEEETFTAMLHGDAPHLFVDESEDDLFVGPTFAASGPSLRPTVKQEVDESKVGQPLRLI